MVAPRTPPAVARRILVVAPDVASLRRNRNDLISALIAARHQLMVLVPDAEGGAAGALEGPGLTVRLCPGADRIGALASGRAVDTMTKEIGDWQPHIAIVYGPATLVHGALAAAKAGVAHIVPLVSRLDPVLLSGDRRPAWLGGRLVGSAFQAASVVVCHNREDARRLSERGLVRPGTEIVVVPGAGVDLARFPSMPLPSLAAGLTIVMIARKERRTGVIAFCEAARQVRARAPHVRFVLAGPDGRGSDALADSALSPYADAVEVRGDLEDVRKLLGEAHLFVYPSLREGMPRVVLEALATGRPVITTDTPGCRETVDERVNGILVPADDPARLAEAIQSVLKRPDLIPAMARASRLKAERRFDVRAVNQSWFAALGLG